MPSAANLDLASQQHPGPDELSAYLEGSLAGTERTQIEAHLAGCDGCREDVVEVLRLFRPAARRRVWYVAAGVAAAALAGLLVLALPLGQESGPAGPVLRGPPTALPEENLPSIQIVQPVEGSTLEPAALHFAWRALDPTASYRVTITNETGDVVWTESTTDTTASLPPDSVLSREATYFWYVDALMPGGRSFTSGVHEFRIAR